MWYRYDFMNLQVCTGWSAQMFVPVGFCKFTGVHGLKCADWVFFDRNFLFTKKIKITGNVLPP